MMKGGTVIGGKLYKSARNTKCASNRARVVNILAITHINKHNIAITMPGDSIFRGQAINHFIGFFQLLACGFGHVLILMI